jgi:hypothetical protein
MFERSAAKNMSESGQVLVVLGDGLPEGRAGFSATEGLNICPTKPCGDSEEHYSQPCPWNHSQRREEVQGGGPESRIPFCLQESFAEAVLIVERLLGEQFEMNRYPSAR